MGITGSAMTPEQIADCRSDLLAFTRTMFRARKGADMKPNWHQEAICNALERVVLGDTTRLIINISPRSGKTELAVVSFIAWATGIYPDSEWIHASYSKRLATNNAYGVREVMRHEVYQEIFPWVKIRDDSSAKDEFRTEQGGVGYAAGSEGSITGRGAGGMSGRFQGAIVIDDPHKPGEANSDVMRQNVIDWFSTTMESRKNRPDTPIIVIKQRLHENDLSGWLLSGGNGEKWDHIKIPAITESGDSFWPDQFPITMLERMQAANPYVFAGQYMQEPAPIGGGDFKTGNIQVVDALPSGLSFVRGWDLAGTTKKTSDYTASVKLAVKDGIVWIAHANHFKGSPDEVESSIVQYAKMDANTKQSLPQDPGQAGVAQKASISKKLQGIRFEFSTESGDKRTRASPLAAQVNVGNVRMLRGDWNQLFINELGIFPNDRHDDLVDASSRAYNATITARSGVMIARA